MCGRAYETFTDEELEARYFNKKHPKLPKIKPNYNLSPTQTSPIVYERDHERRIELFRWGLVPLWAKDVKSADKYSMINAKAEEIAEKRSYKNAFRKQRCILPLSGFYEWLRTEGPGGKPVKRPFAIYLKDHSIMSLAGIWEYWHSENEEVYSFSIITTDANKFMSKIHNRMPVILSPEDEAKWLNPELQDPAELQKFLKPCPDDWLAAHEVSTKVNSPRNNSAELLNKI